MKKFKDLLAGVYSGYDNEGNYGWLLITMNGGSVFFIRNFTRGCIKHSLIDDHVATVIRELDPEKDRKEFKELHQLIVDISLHNHIFLELVDEIRKIVIAISLIRYGNGSSIQFP